jgi:hypothetical protein
VLEGEHASAEILLFVTGNLVELFYKNIRRDRASHATSWVVLGEFGDVEKKVVFAKAFSFCLRGFWLRAL